jgi:ankyrin repeat protein
MTPLHFACEKGSLEIVQLLINQGVDINAKTNIFSNIIPFYFKYYQIIFKIL